MQAAGYHPTAYFCEGSIGMAVSLFSHNAEAYETAIAMLAETGKATIIHPTGTG